MIISEKQTSIMLFVMILLFIVCNFPKNIINIYEGYLEIKVWMVFWNIDLCIFVIIELQLYCIWGRLASGDGDTKSYISYNKFLP